MGGLFQFGVGVGWLLLRPEELRSMTVREHTKSIGGLLTLVVLLGLLTAHVVHPEVTVSYWVVAMLLSLVAALLNVDIWEEMNRAKVTKSSEQKQGGEK